MCKKKNRSEYSTKIGSIKGVYGSHTIHQELQHGHEQDFRQYFRMSISIFYTLLAKMESYIMKKKQSLETVQQQKLMPPSTAW